MNTESLYIYPKLDPHTTVYTFIIVPAVGTTSVAVESSWERAYSPTGSSSFTVRIGIGCSVNRVYMYKCLEKELMVFSLGQQKLDRFRIAKIC